MVYVWKSFDLPAVDGTHWWTPRIKPFNFGSTSGFGVVTATTSIGYSPVGPNVVSAFGLTYDSFGILQGSINIDNYSVNGVPHYNGAISPLAAVIFHEKVDVDGTHIVRDVIGSNGLQDLGDVAIIPVGSVVSHVFSFTRGGASGTYDVAADVYNSGSQSATIYFRGYQVSDNAALSAWTPVVTFNGVTSAADIPAWSTMNSGGGYTFAYEQVNGSNNSHYLHFQGYNADGTQIGTTSFDLGTLATTTTDIVSVRFDQTPSTATPSAVWAVVTDEITTTDHRLFLRINDHGTVTPVSVATGLTANQTFSVYWTGSGNIFVAYGDQAGSGWTGKVYSPTGTLLNTFSGNSGTFVQSVGLTDGRFMITSLAAVSEDGVTNQPIFDIYDSRTGGAVFDDHGSPTGRDYAGTMFADSFTGSDAGFDRFMGHMGSDTFHFTHNAFMAAQSSNVHDMIMDLNQGGGAVFNAAEGDVLDLSGILSIAFGDGQPLSSLVRIVEDPSLQFSRLQVDMDGTANGVQWTTIASLVGIHTSHTATVSPAASQFATIGVQASIGNYVDFGGGGATDLLWRSDAGGLAIWNMSGGTVASANDLGIVDSSWKIFGTGDFNGDGKGDMVWRNDGGALALWQMDGGSVSAVADLGIISPLWQIIGVGDFNGDHKSDLLWRDFSGFTAIWQMDGGTVSEVASLGTVDPSWHVIGVADVNGDGKSDMIWRNDAGFLAIWEMNGGAVTTVDSLGTISNDWHIVGSGDFNGDTKSDLIWRNDAGALVIWEMNGGTVNAVHDLGLIGDNWHIAGVGDFNGDGKADLMWNSDAGAAAVWLMDGGTVAEVGDLGTIGQNWSTINHHYDFV